MGKKDGPDTVLKAAIAHFWLVTIHPFEDGYGRIARAVTDMALARAEGTPERFYGMSAQIEADRKQSYLFLKTRYFAVRKGALSPFANLSGDKWATLAKKIKNISL